MCIIAIYCESVCFSIVVLLFIVNVSNFGYNNVWFITMFICNVTMGIHTIVWHLQLGGPLLYLDPALIQNVESLLEKARRDFLLR